jgi:DNA invertase Pin-like site-specific DNA recombinase
MKIVGYVRVSTNRQAERGLGLSVQRKAIKDWAKANGHRLVDIHEDAGISGSNGIDDREGLADALNLLHDGQADGLVVLCVDRLARDLMIQEAVLAKVWDLGGSVYTVETGEVRREDANDLDDDGPYRTAMRQIMGTFSELEKKLIVRRLKAGRKAKAAQGGYAYGSPPFGWHSVDGKLVPVPEQQATLARIRELYSSGHSLRSIAVTLTAEGRPPQRGDTWHPATLAKIIARL